VNFGKQDSDQLMSMSVIKFRDNIKFSLDSEALREEVRLQFDYERDVDTLKGKGKIIELMSGVAHEEEFILGFRGFFRQHVEARLWLPSGVGAKDYDRYSKGKPYVLVFDFDSLEPFDTD
jgi:hypothetical protein